MDSTLRLARMILGLRPEELGAAVKKILGVRRKIFTVDGFRLWLDPASNLGFQLLSKGEIEKETRATIEKYLHPGDVFVDVGGNEGWFSLRAARCVGTDGFVYCIEPQERLWPVILKNITMNDLSQCRLLPYAVGEKEEDVDLRLSLSVNSGSTSIIAPQRPRVRKRQGLHVTTLDRLAGLYGIGRITLLKIDIEGYELFALRGMTRLLASGAIRHILIEFHPAQLKKLGQSRDDIVNLIEGSGYRTSDGTVWHARDHE